MTQPRVSLTGVFGEIRHLKQMGPNEYKAFAQDGRFLLEVDEQGATQVLNADVYRIRVTLKP